MNKLFIASIFLFYVLVVSAFPQEQIIEVNFAEIKGTDTEHEKTLKSIVKVRDIGEQYATGGLYLMTHYGSLDELFLKENHFPASFFPKANLRVLQKKPCRIS